MTHASPRSYPKSFPTKEEEAFLKLALSRDEDFPALWEAWRGSIVFDNDVHLATMRLLPLIAPRLKRFSIEDDTTGRISGIHRMAWYNNQILVDAARDATAALNSIGIEPVALKGIPLVLTAYEDVGARYMSDIDLLVDPSDAARAVDALLAHGWSLGGNRSLLRNFVDPENRKFTREITLTSARGTELDLHTAIFDFDLAKNVEPKMSYAAVRDALRPLSIKGAKARMLSPEDMLIHVIVHGASGNNHRTLRWVTDANAVIRSAPVDWDVLRDRALRLDHAVEMNFGLEYLANRMNLPIPERTLNALAEAASDRSRIEEYYAKADNLRLNTLGAVPALWTAYWRYERKGSPFFAWIGFPDYLCRAWALSGKRELPSFGAKILRKHTRYWKQRVRQYLRGSFPLRS